MLILGVGLLAEDILATGPFDDSVAVVEHSSQFTPAPLDTVHCIIFAPYLPVVEGARVRLIWLLVERGEDFGVTPLAVVALAPAATSTCPPFSASTTTTTVVALLDLALMGALSFDRGLFLRGDGSPRPPPGPPLVCIWCVSMKGYSCTQLEALISMTWSMKSPSRVALLKPLSSSFSQNVDVSQPSRHMKL